MNYYEILYIVANPYENEIMNAEYIIFSSLLLIGGGVG
jgi:hypothetical protein